MIPAGPEVQDVRGLWFRPAIVDGRRVWVRCDPPGGAL